MAFRKFVLLIGMILGAGLASQALAQSSPSAFTTGMRYDADRRVTGTISPDPDGAGALHYAAVRNTYDSAGRLTTVEKGELASWQSEAVTPASWTGFTVLQRVDTGYDALDHKVWEAESLSTTVFNLTQISYDNLGRVDCTVERMNPAAFASAPAACTLGTAGTSGPDRITHNVYDAAGQVLKVQKAYGITTANGFPTTLQQDYATYTYSPTGKQTSVTDADGNLATMGYDGQDREITWTFPSPTTHGSVNAADFEQYGYDANGNRLSLRKRDTTTITYSYDALNRVIQKNVSASVTGAAAYSVFTGYDNRGLQTYARFGSISGPGITEAYDNVGRLTSSTNTMGGASRTLAYQYDADGDRTQITHPDGTFFTYNYDGLDRMTQPLVNGGGVLASIGYDQLGRRSWMVRTYGDNTTYLYDGASRLQNQVEAYAGGTGNDTVTLGYNPASQIVSQARINTSYEWTEAQNVNRAYVVNGLNQYVAAGTAPLGYDANGNLDSDGTNNYVYDGENRLVSARSGATTFVQLSYDPLGRLSQKVGAATTNFLYDGDQLAVEYDGAGNVLRRFVDGPDTDEPLVWYEGATLSQPSFLHADHHGSITGIAAVGATLASINTYDEWGVPGSANQAQEPFQYTGQMWIPELGFYYYKARMYSSRLGRFLQTDPIGYKDQVNLYNYVDNDPLNHTDASGMCPICLAPLAPEIAGGISATVTLITAYFLGAPKPMEMRRSERSSKVQSSVRSRSQRQQGTTVYRLHGGISGPLGHSWTPVDPRSMANPRDALGLPNGNTATTLSTGQLVDKEGVIVRPALPLDGNKGGAPELLVPSPGKQIQGVTQQPFQDPRNCTKTSSCKP